jgi:hypothetical protein
LSPISDIRMAVLAEIGVSIKGQSNRKIEERNLES